MQEKFDVLDENGELAGETKNRSLVHRDGDWHKAAHVWIINSANEVLLQRRSANKDSHPNMLDISSAGHVTAGDNSLTTAVKEIQEELGINVNTDDLQFIKTIKILSKYASDFINNEFDDMYILQMDIKMSDIKLQKEEVAEVLFVPFEEFVEMIKSQQPDLLRHDEEFKILIEKFGTDTE